MTKYAHSFRYDQCKKCTVCADVLKVIGACGVDATDSFQHVTAELHGLMDNLVFDLIGDLGWPTRHISRDVGVGSQCRNQSLLEARDC